MVFDQGDTELHSITSATIERDIGSIVRFAIAKRVSFQGYRCGPVQTCSSQCRKAGRFYTSKIITALVDVNQTSRRRSILRFGHYEKALQIFVAIQTHREDFLNQNVNE